VSRPSPAHISFEAEGRRLRATLDIAKDAVNDDLLERKKDWADARNVEEQPKEGK
jgi:hypothetical protein